MLTFCERRKEDDMGKLGDVILHYQWRCLVRGTKSEVVSLRCKTNWNQGKWRAIVSSGPTFEIFKKNGKFAAGQIGLDYDQNVICRT